MTFEVNCKAEVFAVDDFKVITRGCGLDLECGHIRSRAMTLIC